MKAPEEKGFLSHKFDNWESEPIPNGWSRIENELNKDRKRGMPFWIWSALIGTFIVAPSLWLTFQNKTSPELAKVSPSEMKIHASTQAANEPGEAQNLAAHETLQKNKLQSQNLPSKSESDSKNLKNTQNIAAGIEQARSYTAYAEIKNPRTNKNSVKISPSFTAMVKDALPKEVVTKNSVMAINLDQKSDAGDKYSAIPTQDNNETTESIGLEQLNTRNAQLQLANLFPGEPLPYVKPPLDENKKAKQNPWRIGVFFEAGILSRTFAINQAEAVHHLKITNAEKPADAYAWQIGTQIRKRIFRQTEWFSSLTIGQSIQKINLENTAKSPISYEMAHTHDLNFEVLPQWKKVNETQNRTLVFSMLEAGFYQPISSRFESGPWVSLVSWTRWTERNNSNLDGSLFHKAQSNVAFSYRVGYQHQLTSHIQTKLFFSPLPEGLFANYSGLTIKPRWIGAGLQYQF